MRLRLLIVLVLLVAGDVGAAPKCLCPEAAISPNQRQLCLNMGKVAKDWAQLRDHGVPKGVLRQGAAGARAEHSQDTLRLDTIDVLERMAGIIYTETTMPPDLLAWKFYDECVRMLRVPLEPFPVTTK
jgi:hypothetical protein